MKGTVGELGEFGLIRELTSRLTTTPAVRLGPGDDAAVVAAPDRRVVATTDVLLEGRHFRRDWSTAYDVGRKAAAQNLADIAAMGAVPTALLLGLVVPAELPATWAVELMDGLRDECQVPGAAVVGGGGAGDQPRVLQASQDDVSGLPGDEGRAGEVGVGHAGVQGQQFESGVLRHGQPVLTQDLVHGAAQGGLGTFQQVSHVLGDVLRGVGRLGRHALHHVSILT